MKHICGAERENTAIIELIREDTFNVLVLTVTIRSWTFTHLHKLIVAITQSEGS